MNKVWRGVENLYSISKTTKNKKVLFVRLIPGIRMNLKLFLFWEYGPLCLLFGFSIYWFEAFSQMQLNQMVNISWQEHKNM